MTDDIQDLLDNARECFPEYPWVIEAVEFTERHSEPSDIETLKVFCAALITAIISMDKANRNSLN